MNKIISFIIPSYNVEQYLSRALDSFLLNKLQNKLDLQEKIEVIVVDDGSKDGTANIAEKYVKQNPNVFRLLKKENGGHGSAINEGTRLAVGKYLKIIDADDWIVTENLPSLIENLESCEADVVLNPFHMVNMQTNNREIQCMYLENYKRTYTLNEIMGNWELFRNCMTFHGIMYKREFYEDYRHELPEKIFYEDQEYASIPCCHAKTILAINLFLYQYLIGNETQSISSHNQLKRISHIEQVTQHMLRYYIEHTELSDSGRTYLLKKIEDISMSYYVIANIINSNKKEGRKWSKEFNQKIKQIDAGFFECIKKKYVVYAIFNHLGMGMKAYENILNSNFYYLLKKKHKRSYDKL